MIGGLLPDAVLLAVVVVGIVFLYRSRRRPPAVPDAGFDGDFDGDFDGGEPPETPARPFRGGYPRMARQAGLDPEGALWSFWLAKLLLAVALPLGLFELWSRYPSRPPPAALVALALVGFLLPDLWLFLRRRHRRQRIRAALSYFLDLLVALLYAGLSLEEAFRRAAYQGLAPSDPLAREARLVSAELDAGREQGQAFRALAERTGVTELRAVASALRLAARHGAPVESALGSQADMLRVKRRENARREIVAAATKAIFPVFLCGFPVFLVIIFFPAVLEIIETLRLLTGR